MKNPVVTQIAVVPESDTHFEHLYAVRADGTVWIIRMSDGKPFDNGWTQLPDLPLVAA